MAPTVHCNIFLYIRIIPHNSVESIVLQYAAIQFIAVNLLYRIICVSGRTRGLAIKRYRHIYIAGSEGTIMDIVSAELEATVGNLEY